MPAPSRLHRSHRQTLILYRLALPYCKSLKVSTHQRPGAACRTVRQTRSTMHTQWSWLVLRRSYKDKKVAKEKGVVWDWVSMYCLFDYHVATFVIQLNNVETYASADDDSISYKSKSGNSGILKPAGIYVWVVDEREEECFVRKRLNGTYCNRIKCVPWHPYTLPI